MTDDAKKGELTARALMTVLSPVATRMTTYRRPEDGHSLVLTTSTEVGVSIHVVARLRDYKGPDHEVVVAVQYVGDVNRAVTLPLEARDWSVEAPAHGHRPETGAVTLQLRTPRTDTTGYGVEVKQSWVVVHDFPTGMDWELARELVEGRLL